MDGGEPRETGRELAFEARDDVETPLDPIIVRARDFVREVDEGSKVSRLGREELLIKGMEVGRTTLAQRVGEEAEALTGARFDERRHEQPIDECNRRRDAVAQRRPFSLRAHELAELGGVGVERRRTERDSSPFELPEHPTEMGKLLFGQGNQETYDLRRLGGSHR